MNIPGIKVVDAQALKAWLETTDHQYNCTSWSEGQDCCLDRLVAEDKTQPR